MARGCAEMTIDAGLQLSAATSRSEASKPCVAGGLKTPFQLLQLKSARLFDWMETCMNLRWMD